MYSAALCCGLRDCFVFERYKAGCYSGRGVVVGREAEEIAEDLSPGIYEQIVDQILEGRLTHSGLEQFTEDLDPGDSHTHLAQFVSHVLSKNLQALRSHKTEGDKLSRQIAVCNELIQYLQELEPGISESSPIAQSAMRLIALEEKTGRRFRERPDTPLATGCLLTGTRLDPSLVSQLKKEILTSERVDILCSFVKWTGIRVLQDEFRQFTAHAGARLRIITTSYMGATDLKAIDFLRELPNTSLKVSYDTRRTRLHAKAYLFYRNSGFNTAYIGSANLSHAALTDGLEWNVKVSSYEQPYLWEKISSTFETYWLDKEFEPYDRAERKRLGDALAMERGDSSPSDFDLPLFELRPYMFQQEVLERISAERKIHDRYRHLIVAATGTGKTVLAAFDYHQWRKDFRERNNRTEPRLLFIAHREEILRQSIYTFRAVLRDQNFGDLMVGSNVPTQLDQLFVSIQSFNAKSLRDDFSPKHFDYIVVDEFHHACAPTYAALLEHFQPRVLLGLTATPERTDGLDVTRYFGGHITAEIRLPDAIGRKLLCPFQYFGISDSVDYSQIKWRRGGYDRKDLDNVLTGDDLRARRIAEKTIDTVLDIQRARGIGFCVSKAHAEFMTRVFCELGIPSACLTADSADVDRRTIRKRLVDGDVNFVFVVDLFNEGVDIPPIDTVLFLRPTESLTVFLQQLGRGLRLHEDKECLTVLDFVGQAHRNFRYDVLFRALLTSEANSLEREIESGFPHLPSGCSITLERKSREYILENIRASITSRRDSIVQRIRSFEEESGKPLTYANFLDYHRLELDEIYRRCSWSRLCELAGVAGTFSELDEPTFSKAFRRMQHVEDIEFIRSVLGWLDASKKNLGGAGVILQRHIEMLYFSFFPPDKEGPGIHGFARILGENPTMAQELRRLLQYCMEKSRHIPVLLDVEFVCPLQMHCRYSISEIRAALGHLTIEHRKPFREGVLHIPELPADAFFITLEKTESRYSPTTMYEDYAIDESHFHWQSQSTTSLRSPTGQRYINHEERRNPILLFVREHARVRGRAMPFYFLGPAIYKEHHGERPISIVWRLVHPMPAELQRWTERLAVQ